MLKRGTILTTTLCATTLMTGVALADVDTDFVQSGHNLLRCTYIDGIAFEQDVWRFMQSQQSDPNVVLRHVALARQLDDVVGKCGYTLARQGKFSTPEYLQQSARRKAAEGSGIPAGVGTSLNRRN